MSDEPLTMEEAKENLEKSLPGLLDKAVKKAKEDPDPAKSKAALGLAEAVLKLERQVAPPDPGGANLADEVDSLIVRARDAVADVSPQD